MKPGPRGRRAVYLLPNLFTTAALFCGFYALLMTVAGKWAEAATAIFAAIVFDACDGRVARMTGTQSEFGAEYDSLSDVVAFGAAPALLMHQWCLQEIGRWGAAAAFAYCAATALRLARFNVQTGEADRRFFIGIPSPAAAALAAAFVWTLARADVDGTAGAWPFVCALLAVALAATMVSGVRYHSFKELSLRRRISFRAGALIILALAATLMLSEQAAEWALLFVFGAYFLSGHFLGLRALWLRRRRRQAAQSESPKPDSDQNV